MFMHQFAIYSVIIKCLTACSPSETTPAPRQPQPQCPHLTLANGRIVMESTESQNTVKFSCIDGFELKGDAKKQCRKSSGKWLPSGKVSCKPLPGLTCEKPQQVPGASVAYSEPLVEGSLAKYQCKDASDSRISTCNRRRLGASKSQLSWTSLRQFSCELEGLFPCERPHSIAHGSWTIWRGYVVYKCEKNFRLSFTQPLICDKDTFTWRPAVTPNCIPYCPGSPISLASRSELAADIIDNTDGPAAVFRCLQPYKILIGKAFVRCRNDLQWQFDRPKCEPAEEFFSACREGNAAEVRRILSQSTAHNLRDRDSDGKLTCLMWASRSEFTQLVEYLLALESIKINLHTKLADGGFGETALHFAAKLGFSEIVALLLVGGAAPNTLTNLDANGNPTESSQSPLDIATAANHLEIIRLLQNNGGNRYRATGDELFSSCKRGDILAVMWVLTSPLLHVDQQDARNESRTCLMHATIGNHLSLVRYLVQNESADLNLQSSWVSDSGDYPFHWTALNFAVYHAHMDVIRYLLQKGAQVSILDRLDANKEPTRLSSTVLSWARCCAQSRREEIVALLEQYGAEIYTTTTTTTTLSTTPKLATAVCELPPRIDNGIIFLIRDGNPATERQPASAIVLYRCHAGFRLVGDNVLICRTAGDYSSRPPTCSRVLSAPTTGAPSTLTTPEAICPPPPTVSRGSILLIRDGRPEHDFQPLAAFVIYRCNNGFDMVGQTVLVCTVSGEYSSPPPTCRRRATAKPRQKTTTVKLTRKPVTTTTMRPQQGFDQCREQSCESPPSLINGQYEIEVAYRLPNEKTVKFAEAVGGYVNYSCNDGYRLIGTKRIQCKRNPKVRYRPAEPGRCRRLGMRRNEKDSLSLD